ncbi:two-component sensor histidine kinase [Virgisporangium aliadipatigenens]|uniref:Signal transduction histidine-protein kinase/phosphatase MprB n=1 Tax=Virgisporangium aliadipatigenens TaxID=741659 RepID=A0A8J4DST0_9ACTN|nr:HAMP domain-containing sensor histidine kinase [Virgisporangium aliadipatigenens]GIJ49044.1 two-component sensor histidine kinase [Virgisporangium aliadipatigenens]
MRWILNRLALAITSMVALAFLVPLAVLTRQIAHDRAVDEARQQATGIVAALAVGTDPDLIERAVASTPAGGEGRLAVHLPGNTAIGSPHAALEAVAAAARSRRPTTVEYADGIAYLQPSVLDGNRTAVIEVFVDSDDMYRGVWVAWFALAGLAIVLVLGSTAVADRLGWKVVRATRSLAEVTRQLGDGDLSVRAAPRGPKELREVARSFNDMADNMTRLVDSERELAADLSHRLRTPLTALRLDAEAIPPGPVAERMRQAFDLLDQELEAIITGARVSITKRTAQTTDLVEVLADRLAFWSVLAEDQQRPNTVVGGEYPVPVNVARGELILAIDALLGNVFAHTPEGTAFRVTVSDVGLVVDDAGPGIPDPEKAVQRGHSGAGSTGLGLDIAQRIAIAAGGRLSITRGPMGGAQVAMLLDR